MNKEIWNKLGELAQVQFSEIGPNGIQHGTIAYAAGKFDNGVQNCGSVNYPQFPEVISLGKFTADLWYIPSLDSSSGIYRDIICSHPYADPSESWAFYVFEYANTFRISMEFPGFFSYYNFPTSYSATDQVHYGIAINKDAADGQRMRFFLNGVEQTPFEIVNDNAWTPVFAKSDFCISTVWGPVYGVIDDLVIWDDVKTDYSDRIYEGRVAPPSLKRFIIWI